MIALRLGIIMIGKSARQPSESMDSLITDYIAFS